MNAHRKHIFYHQISVMLEGGLTILSALELLRKTGDYKVKKVASVLHNGIQKGEQVYKLMQKDFTSLEINIIKAGELSGRLPEVLKTLSKYFEKVDITRKRLITGIVYPVFLLHCAILLPSLPYLILKGPVHYIVSVFPALLVLYAMFFLFIGLKNFSIKLEFLDKLKIRIPFLGNFIKTKASINFLSSFACLYNAGVNIISAVRISIPGMGNIFLQRNMQSVLSEIEKGATLSSAISLNPYLKPVLVDMIRIGEEGGRLEDMLNKSIDILQQDFDTSIERFVQIFPLIVYLLVAVYVGYIVISFYTSYYSGIF